MTTSPNSEPEAPGSNADYSGWKTLTGKGGAYSIRVPPTYIAASDSPDEIKKALDQVQSKMAQTFDEAAKNKKLDLFAMDLSSESVRDGFADNINIFVASWMPENDEELERVGKELTRTMPSRFPMATEVMDLAGKKVFRYTGSMVYASDDGKALESELTGFLVPHKGKTYTVTLVTNEGGVTEAAETFDKIIRSMTWHSISRR